MNKPIISTLFQSVLSNVDTAAGGLGAAVADMLATGHAEYLTFKDFREAVRAGLSPASWSTVTNYMAPMSRAWENNKVTEFCDTCREKGIKAALKLFPAGTGKRGDTASGKVETVQPETVAPVVDLAAQNDALIAEFEAERARAELDAELDALRAENAALRAENDSLKILVDRLAAQNASLLDASKAKASKASKLKAAA